MSARPSGTLPRRLLAIVAIVFGLATVVAGMRVLGGADPGYVVFRPLLIFNTAMGVVYVATGIIMLLSLGKGMFAAAAVFILNLLVLGAISYLYLTGDGVAVDSLGAMTFRTGVWLVLFLGLVWLKRGRTFWKARSQ